jgi:hypothetical protein|tara:strand:- start:4771 stop:5127 length:357 start_codon:yes stop_codon:yes gene_type:complete
MAIRKNKKRIDPRYFLHETTYRDLDEGKETLAQWEAVAIAKEEVKFDDNDDPYYIVDKMRAREASRLGAISTRALPYGEHGAQPNEQLFLVYPGSMSHWIGGPKGWAMSQQNPRINKI